MTSNIMAETWRLKRRVPPNAWIAMIRQMMIILRHVGEVCVPSRSVMASKHFARFGVTDVGLMMLRACAGVWTADLALYDAALKDDLDMINFMHLPHRF